ncbi:hypothetical protein RCL_jg677.t1 [Rhizophagus clarus]|uniref:Uncharacterized protein n=1 Tax=Rhizophagus clarus TaxID=94130 RepID=A0A8H3LPJ3_9GLOM|nr:hypothetical protein RCL_jg677.t1 [Rhizophagus clarus]
MVCSSCVNYLALGPLRKSSAINRYYFQVIKKELSPEISWNRSMRGKLLVFRLTLVIEKALYEQIQTSKSGVSTLWIIKVAASSRSNLKLELMLRLNKISLNWYSSLPYKFSYVEINYACLNLTIVELVVSLLVLSVL